MAKRILYFSISTEMGGAEKSLLDLVTSIQNNSKYDPYVVVPKDSGPVVDELKSQKITYITAEAPRFLLQISRKNYIKSLLVLLVNTPLFIKYILKLNRIICKVHPDIIHSAALKGHLLLALSYRRTQTIWHFRDIIHSPLTRIILKLFRPKNVRIVCNSKATLKSLQTPCPADVIYNGISEQKYSSGTSTVFNENFQIPNNSIKIGCIGAFARWKGQLEFIDLAFHYKRDPSIYFFLVGDEIYDTDSEFGIRAEIEKKIKSYQLQKKVFICGFQQNIEEYYHSLDVLIHTSIKPEPFGRVLIEALATKTPIIAANDGGVPEILQHNTTGFLYQPGSTPQMKHYLDKLIYNPEYAKRFTENGYNTFLQKFTLETSIQKTISLYENILQDNSAPSFQN